MSLTAEIISVGTELLLGNIVNTDAQAISEALSGLGINVYYHTVVGDNPARLARAVEIAKSRADILITTGGLGPTVDDLTKETVAGAFGKKLVLHEPTLARINSYFTHLGRVPTKNNERQAWLPEGCEILENDWGTAPGCAFEAEGKHVIMLPGPPRECVSMLNACAVPYLRRLSDAAIISSQIHIFGLGESAVEEMLHDMMETMQNPTVAPYAKEGEVMVRVTAKAATEKEARDMLAPVVDEIKRRLGSIVYSVDIDTLEETVAGLLKEKKMTLALAESCTGGLLSKRITDVPGVSAVYAGGVCAYSNHAKTTLLSIDPGLIKEHGAVSEQVANEMSRSVRRLLNADIGIGVTGFAGPDGEPPDKPAGLVFVSISTRDGEYCKRLMLGTSRNRVRVSASSNALDLIRRYLTGLEF